jgi:RNA polymerase sigma factor (sigma-70 family)
MDPRKLSTQELVQLCLDSKDEAIWREFVRRFQPLIAGVIIKSLCRRNRFNLSLVDDLVQDTFLKLCVNNFKALREFEFRHENAFFGFLKVITAHVVEDYWRRVTNDKNNGGKEPEDLDQVYPPPAPESTSDSAESLVLMGEIDQYLIQTLAAEPNFTRDYSIFWLYYRQGLTAKAISQVPGVKLSVKGVESTLLRLVRLLRDGLNGSTVKKNS